MPGKRRSDRRAKELFEEFLDEVWDVARSGQDVSPMGGKFWDLAGTNLAYLAEVLTLIQEEAAQEQLASSGEKRYCVVCNAQLVRRHPRGRWPIYCDLHSVKDR